MLKYLLLALLFISSPCLSAPKRFTHVQQLTSDNVNFAGKSALGTATAGDTVNIDYTLPFDVCLTGATLIVKGGKTLDTVSLQVVHPQAGVLSEFITDWYIAEDQDVQFTMDISYPANLSTGLIIRAVYKAAVGLTGTRTVRINYILHKVIEQQ